MFGGLLLRQGRQRLHRISLVRHLSQRVTSQNSMTNRVAKNTDQRTHGASNKAGLSQREESSIPLYSPVSSVEENLIQVLMLQRTSFDKPNHIYERTVRDIVSTTQDSVLHRESQF